MEGQLAVWLGAGLGDELSLAISSDPAVPAGLMYGLMGAPDLRSAEANPPGEETPLCGPTSFPMVIYCYKEPTASAAVDLHCFV